MAREKKGRKMHEKRGPKKETKRGQIYFRGEKGGGTLGQLKPKAQRVTPAPTSTVPTQFNTVTHQIPKTKKPQISRPEAFSFHIWCAGGLLTGMLSI
ncbi:hypothetical protein [Pseudomonas lactis]|uniref:hypothetical protein n=1 Tax=Pseudomonas lactis TaxID=1615674 RepID=UPI003F7CDEA3